MHVLSLGVTVHFGRETQRNYPQTKKDREKDEKSYGPRDDTHYS